MSRNLNSFVATISPNENISGHRKTGWFSMYLAVAALIIFGLVNPQASYAKDGAVNQHWVGTWSSNPVEKGELFEGQTLRQIVRISLGGDQLRIRFSNRFGEVPLVIDAASIGIQDVGAEVVPGSLQELTFGGSSSVSIAAGAKVWSDPVELSVPDEADLAVSMYIAENNTGGSTKHTLAWQTSYIASGDFTGDEVMPVKEITQSWFWLTGVDIKAHRNTLAVATLGDSITEGCCLPAFIDANVRYPDYLARLLLDRYQGETRAAVLNSGISGNRILSSGGLLPRLGPNVQNRLDVDVLTQSGVEHVIMLIGVNDLGLGEADFGGGFILGPVVDAEEIIAGYKQVIRRIQDAGMQVLVGTILPFKGFSLPGYWSETNEAKRQAINDWIRTSELHDGFVDFDAALQDPEDPEFLLPIYDGGDGLHPSAAGYERMALEAEQALLLPGKGRIKRN
jgi:lysophospholipase L1-like esterase